MPTPDAVAAPLISAVAALVSALAWPLVVGAVALTVLRRPDRIAAGLQTLIGSQGSAKLALSSTGISIEVARAAGDLSAKAVIDAAQKAGDGPLDAAAKAQVTESAKAAALDLSATAFDIAKRFRVLWADDHPENNVGLQVAFQALGIIVVCVDSDGGFKRALEAAGSFDVVVTDMHRDGLTGSRRVEEPEAGLKTIDLVRSRMPGVPVIVFAGAWARTHRDAPLADPVIQVTNAPSKIYDTIVGLAKQKARPGAAVPR